MLRSRCSEFTTSLRLRGRPVLSVDSRRGLLTLAIESSCDDTSVAVLEKDGDAGKARIHFHETVTADNAQYQGIHPLSSLESHQAQLPGLVHRALHHLPRRSDGSNAKETFPVTEGNDITYHQKPRFVCATRGPGMRSSLSAGLDFGKGLALGLAVPFLGVHHMQAHALAPRLVHALERGPGSKGVESGAPQHRPGFPFLTLLASGGHTLLLKSNSITSHKLLASSSDTPIGNSIDQIARLVLPPEILASATDTSYGKLLEAFAFPAPLGAAADYAYAPPASRKEELRPRTSEWGWAFTPPLAQEARAAPSEAMRFSFVGLQSTAMRIVQTGRSHAGAGSPLRGADGLSPEERRALAREAMRAVFEHVAGRVIAALEHGGEGIETLVLSGGVAANRYLRHILRAFLDVRGFAHVQLSVPPTHLCTDNAAMIAWAGVEMWEAGWESEPGCLPLKKWGLDDADPEGNGGILGVGGWRRRAG